MSKESEPQLHVLPNEVNESAPLPDLMKVEEVAQVLRVHRNTVYRLLVDGELKACKVGRNYRISKDDLLDYLGVEEAVRGVQDSGSQEPDI